jgi:hypothetical protein
MRGVNGASVVRGPCPLILASRDRRLVRSGYGQANRLTETREARFVDSMGDTVVLGPACSIGLLVVEPWCSPIGVSVLERERC